MGIDWMHNVVEKGNPTCYNLDEMLVQSSSLLLRWVVSISNERILAVQQITRLKHGRVLIQAGECMLFSQRAQGSHEAQDTYVLGRVCEIIKVMTNNIECEAKFCVQFDKVKHLQHYEVDALLCGQLSMDPCQHSSACNLFVCLENVNAMQLLESACVKQLRIL